MGHPHPLFGLDAQVFFSEVFPNNFAFPGLSIYALWVGKLLFLLGLLIPSFSMSGRNMKYIKLRSSRYFSASCECWSHTSQKIGLLARILATAFPLSEGKKILKFSETRPRKEISEFIKKCFKWSENISLNTNLFLLIWFLSPVKAQVTGVFRGILKKTVF